MTDGFHEDVELENLSEEPRRVRARVPLRRGLRRRHGGAERQPRKGRLDAELGKRSISLSASRNGYRRGTKITFRKEGLLRRDAMRFDLELGPRERWKTCIDVVPVVDSKPRPSLLALRLVQQARSEDGALARGLDGDGAEARLGRRRPQAHLRAGDRRSRRASAEAQRQLRVGAAGRRCAVVHDRLRARLIIALVPGSPVPPDSGGDDPGGARGPAGTRLRSLRRRGAREDPARAPAGERARGLARYPAATTARTTRRRSS